VTPEKLERALEAYVTEAEAAERLGVSRQALHKRSETTKRSIGGIRSPSGWIFRRDALQDVGGATP